MDYLRFGKDMLMEGHGTWWKVSMVTSLGIWRHVTEGRKK